MDSIIQEFHYTSQFLSNHFGFDPQGPGSQQVLNELLNHLQFDGYDLRRYDELIKPSRNLAEASGDELILNLVLIFVCVLCAGFASGLTQGLLSLDVLEMTVKAQSGTPKEKEYAAKLLPIIKPHHLLLVTLMLWNASATEALPIFLDAIVPEYVAIIISVTLVLLFGEIIPASILTGPKQLQITSTLTPLVYLVLVLFFPIAYPISKLLDWVIGHEEGLTLYNKGEIATMMRMQHEEAMRRSKMGHTVRDSVHNEEVMIIGGALKFREMKVSDVMTPLAKTYMLSARDVLSYKVIHDIFKAGYSRIPVYDKDKNDIVGLLLAKDLIFVDPEDETPISNFVEFFGRKPVMVWHDELLGETLSTFRRERAHLAMVRDVMVEGSNDPYYIVVGVITLEDIIEEILGAEIEDEFDYDGEENQLTASLRDMDVARLKSLRSKITDDKLSPDEIEAITTYLPKQIPTLPMVLLHRGIQLQDLVMDAQVYVLRRQTPEGILKPLKNDILVRSGRATNTCILILQGKIRIVYDKQEPSGKGGEMKTIPEEGVIAETEELIEKKTKKKKNKPKNNEELPVTAKEVITPFAEHFSLEREEILGPWSIICAEALLHEENSFIPHFTASIYSADLRIVGINSISQFRVGSNTKNVNRREQLGQITRSQKESHTPSFL